MMAIRYLHKLTKNKEHTMTNKNKKIYKNRTAYISRIINKKKILIIALFFVAFLILFQIILSPVSLGNRGPSYVKISNGLLVSENTMENLTKYNHNDLFKKNKSKTRMKGFDTIANFGVFLYQNAVLELYCNYNKPVTSIKYPKAHNLTMYRQEYGRWNWKHTQWGPNSSHLDHYMIFMSHRSRQPISRYAQREIFEETNICLGFKLLLNYNISKKLSFDIGSGEGTEIKYLRYLAEGMYIFQRTTRDVKKTFEIRTQSRPRQIHFKTSNIGFYYHANESLKLGLELQAKRQQEMTYRANQETRYDTFTFSNCDWRYCLFKPPFKKGCDWHVVTKKRKGVIRFNSAIGVSKEWQYSFLTSMKINI